ncbi:hypothetical protein M6B38_223680 [Iris pallida]|uniref:Uncharacterized protein n=1 Tax=Iris pallida TaxID=29817 RepID=A0AAX6DVX7_IRIPA|nr:hypothetical protein M6B38_223680 [Iris pallida]
MCVPFMHRVRLGVRSSLLLDDNRIVSKDLHQIVLCPSTIIGPSVGSVWMKLLADQTLCPSSYMSCTWVYRLEGKVAEQLARVQLLIPFDS